MTSVCLRAGPFRSELDRLRTETICLSICIEVGNRQVGQKSVQSVFTHILSVLVGSWFPDGQLPAIGSWPTSKKPSQTRTHTTRGPRRPDSARAGGTCFCYRPTGSHRATGHRTDNGNGQGGYYKWRLTWGRHV